MTDEFISTIGISGLVLPAGPGSDIAVLKRESVLTLVERAQNMIQRSLAAAHPDEQRLIQTISKALSESPALTQLAMFGNSVAYLDVPPPVFLEDGVRENRNDLQRSLALVRHLIGCPDLEALTLVLPPSALGQSGLYLPHYHALLNGRGGPVAVQIEAGAARLTWEDGGSVALPPPGQVGTITARDGRLFSGLRAAGLPVLNLCPEVAAATGRFGFAGPASLGLAVQALEEGLALLRQVWPEAYADAERMLDGWVILERRDHTRSHTSQRLQGAVMLTPYEPFKVGDLICHEVSHMRMNLLLEKDPLVQGDPAAVHPSPWRKDLRPLIGIFNGVHAFINVCEYYRRLQAVPALSEQAGEIYAFQKANVLKGLNYLKEQAELTLLGAAILDEFEAVAAEL